MEQEIKKAQRKKAIELTRYVEDESVELGIGYLTLIHGCYGSGGDRNAVMKSLSFGLTHPPIFEIIRDVYEYHVRHGWPQSESDPAPSWCFRAHKQSHSKAERIEPDGQPTKT